MRLDIISSIGRNGWMTFASVSAVTVTLLLVGVFVVIMMNLNKVADDLEKDVEIKVMVELTADEAARAILQEEITNISITSIMPSLSKKQYEAFKFNQLATFACRLFHFSNGWRW